MSSVRDEEIEMSSPLKIEKPIERQPEKTAPVPAPEPQVKAETKKGGSARKIIILTILAILLIAGGILGYRTIVFYGHNETTDDAQIDGHINPILPRVSGYVEEVLVKENQTVKAGDRLVRIDTRDLQAKMDQDQAAVANARASVAVNRANVVAARTRHEKDAADVQRYKALRDKEEISRQQYDAAVATSEASAAQVQAAQEQVAAAEAQVRQRQADIESARLQLSYTVLTAPASGIVAKKNVEVGQMVQAGQPLLAIVDGQDMWVTANFKETQLAKMRVGQPVDIEIDAYPGKIFHARIESLSAATGARFSLLPPDNATGNFTKVVQRVPVKIVFTDPPDPQHPLRVGMNVSVVVNVG
jgi:membrane fusion protein (multidrug efflux system)